jgi:hypothetical protein
MKQTLALCLFSSSLTLVAPAAYAKPKASPTSLEAKARAALEAKAKPAPAEAKAKPAPAKPPPAPEAPRPSFWMAADPHVPLAMVDGKAIRSVGKRGRDCGPEGRWAKPKSLWRAVDAWGRITGSYEVSGSELYDVTGCREVSLAPRTGKGGVGLLVSGDSPYLPGESVSYAPSVSEKKRFDRFLGAMESAWVNGRPVGKAVPLGKRTMFFQFAPPAAGERLDGAGKPIERPKRWAVAGGPLLVVAYLGEGGRWKAATIKRPLGLTDSYAPVAVFDMNGDGVPEIVYQSSDGPSFADSVLSLDPESLSWADAAESPGGASL